MATPVIMPRQGQSVESCIISKWHKNKGDKVNIGDLLFSYETDKASFDEESKVEGTLLEIFFGEDDDVPVLTNVCVIGEAGEDTSEFRPEGVRNTNAAAPEATAPATSAAPEAATQIQAAPIQVAPAQAAPAQAAPQAVAGMAPGVSPRAKNTAERLGVNFTGTAGSGPNGRIIEEDIFELQKSGGMATRAAAVQYGSQGAFVEGTGIGGRVTTADLARPAAQGAPEVPEAAPAPALAAAASASAAAALASAAQASAADYTEIKLSNIRKVIANAMHTSLSTTAQLTMNSSFDATEIQNLRKNIKANLNVPGAANITLNDMVLYATARLLAKHKNLNTLMVGDKLLQYNHVHLGVAVDTERGLMVPTIFNADTKSLAELSIEVKVLAEQCQKGTINPDLLKGGTFTVTNLGSLGIESFTPVLNPPQVGILGVNNIVDKVRNVNGNAVLYPSMGLSLTIDHRAVDGAPGARFLKDLAANLERFTYLLAMG
ncbi:MAG: dihydrolipoamide acetyltransferase family protein [Eubacteriales bacterium]|nr:dihydrolipoamide acetyltransferase family protein [Eubacteriales bacterium]